MVHWGNLAAGFALSAETWGLGDVTQEQIEAVINHPLNLIDMHRDEHNKLHKDTQRGSQELDVSHMYEHIRTLSFEEQMEIGLELLYKHAPKTYAKYAEKAEDVIHTSYLISKLS